MVTEVKNYKVFNNNIRQLTKSDFTVKLLNNGVNKINVTNADDYRAATEMLNNNNKFGTNTRNRARPRTYS